MSCPLGKPEVQLILLYKPMDVKKNSILACVYYYVFVYDTFCVITLYICFLLSCTYKLENELWSELKFIIKYMVIDDNNFVNSFIKKWKKLYFRTLINRLKFKKN